MRRVVAGLFTALILAGGLTATAGSALAASPDRAVYVHCPPYTHWVWRVGCVADRTLFRPRYRPRYYGPPRWYPPRRYYPPAPHHPVGPFRRNHA